MNAFPLQLTRDAARLDALHRLDLLDTPPSEAFDRITRMAAQLFGLPIAAVSLTDSNRQWFKSRVGVDHCAIPRDKAPCAAVADEGRMLVIPDLLDDPFYADSVLAGSGIRFYAGAPLMTEDGFCLGAMCVLGMAPRAISEVERSLLQDLAAMVMSQIELQHAIGRVEPVSGLPNRQQFLDDFKDLDMHRPLGSPGLAALVSLATPQEQSSALRVMGSDYVDAMVVEAARLLRATIGDRRKVYHVAPAQFAVLALPGADDGPYLNMLEAWLDERNRALTARFVTTASIGVARFVVGSSDAPGLLRNMHSAAQDAVSTPGKVRLYSEEHDAAAKRRFMLINEFGAALECQEQLRLVYQPKLLLSSGACLGAEALLRWNHPLLGEVSPGEFIPLIEQTSMARATTAWVLEAAMRQLAQWRAAGIHLQLAVNVSAVNLLEPDFCQRVKAGLLRHGLDAACLSLEVTESAIMANPTVAHATLEALSAAGVSLAIDDFGTGHSSLAYLQRLPVKVVKIDQSFMRRLDADKRARTLVATMIDLSHDLGFRVVAEGVETEAVAQLLVERGCDEAQGYLYARPLSHESFSAWFTNRRHASRAKRALLA